MISVPRKEVSNNIVRMSPTEAGDLSRAALRRLGYSPDDASIITDHLVDAALCGYKFAGLPRLLRISEGVHLRGIGSPPKIVNETASSASIDGGGQVGYLAVHYAAQVAIRKAREGGGLSLVGMNNAYFSGRNAYYVEQINRQGFATLHVASGAPRVAAPGGDRPVLGTNPLAFGFPGDPDPFIFDMGTAAMMHGDVQLYSHLDKLLPVGVAVDANGNSTTNAKDALDGSILPFAGYKGFGLSLTIQILGLLAGAENARAGIRGYGFMFLVFDPDLLMPRQDFQNAMRLLLEAVRLTSHAADSEQNIRIPSERAFHERRRRIKDGIELEVSLVKAIEELHI